MTRRATPATEPFGVGVCSPLPPELVEDLARLLAEMLVARWHDDAGERMVEPRSGRAHNLTLVAAVSKVDAK